jgi:putative transposase
MLVSLARITSGLPISLKTSGPYYGDAGNGRQSSCRYRPVRAPKANAVCERLVGTIRRECLDFLIPLGERHLKQVLTNWIAHYNHARVHTSLGPGVPDSIRPSPPMSGRRHHLPAGHFLRSKAVLGGLHHEYWLEKVAA